MYLKLLFCLHFLVLLTMWVKVGGELLVDELRLEWTFYRSLKLPNAYPWEYVWCFSFIPTNLLRYHYYGQFILGILPCAIGLGGQFPELIDYLRDMKNSQSPTFRGTFPMVIIWYIFFVIALQIHIFAMYFSYNLVAAWQPPKKKE
ncbi:unnamed protein product [Gongylonema pulchrum]|uniref:Protein jagunal 1 n=1 Tax=Gongylonema pulchrum TaxID=637853 RepID=A0A183EUP9_9BILA|nr:unnamed protein product [Gongylonema pulchrum]